ncbi:hypothetical protein IIM_00199 [Bacillus cereus VD107]|nr:hypothetical protein IIM_00199 [Bacillus cereus VD107]
MMLAFFRNINEKSSDTTNRRIEDINKDLNEQFFTPMQVAYFMSSMFKPIRKPVINFLDAGAGVGNLTASFIAYVCTWKKKPKKINVLLYEIDKTLFPDLGRNMELCSENDIQDHNK